MSTVRHFTVSFPTAPALTGKQKKLLKRMAREWTDRMSRRRWIAVPRPESTPPHLDVYPEVHHDL